jgi:hypothetical protein
LFYIGEPEKHPVLTAANWRRSGRQPISAASWRQSSYSHFNKTIQEMNNGKCAKRQK